MNFRQSIFLIFSLILSLQVEAAKVWKKEELFKGSTTDWLTSIYISGAIDQDTPRQLSRVVDEIKRSGHDKGDSHVNVWLNSEGGDVEAAIETGTYIRKNELKTWVSSNAICASSCALIYLGGVYRTMFGRYGIHRPYATRLNLSDRDAKEAYEWLNGITSAYLAKMNITPRLLEAMNMVPPSEIRWLTEGEREEFGIDGADPIVADRNQSRIAKKLGISKTELFRRHQSINSQCINKGLSISDVQSCYDDIIQGRRR